MSTSPSFGWERTHISLPTSPTSERPEAVSKETSYTIHDSLQNLPKRLLGLSASSTTAVQTLKKQRPTPSPIRGDELRSRPIATHIRGAGARARRRGRLFHAEDGVAPFKTRRESIYQNSPPLTAESWHSPTASLSQYPQPPPPSHFSTSPPLLPSPSPLSVHPSHCVPRRSSRSSSRNTGVHRSSDRSTSGLSVPSSISLSLFPKPPSYRPINLRSKQKCPSRLSVRKKVGSDDTHQPGDSITLPNEESPTTSILRFVESNYDPWAESWASQVTSMMPREVDDGQQSTGLWGDRLRSRVAPHAMRFANLQTAHQHIANRDSKELSPEPHDQLDSPFGHIQERPYQPQPVLGAVPESDEGESTISNFIGQYESRRGTPESLVQGNGSSKQARARGPQRPLPPDPPRRANHLDRALVESANAGGNTSDPQSYDTTSRLLADSSIEQGRKAQQHLQRASEAVTINSETFSDPSLEGIAGRDRGHVHYVRKSNDFDRSLTWIDPSSTAEDQPHTSARPSLERNPNNPYNNSTRTSGESSSAWTDDHSERSPFDLGDSFEAATRRQQREAEERIDEQEEEYEENGTGHDDEWITVAESSQNVTGSMNHTSALRSPRSNRNLPGLDISHSHLTRPSQVIDEADELDLPQAMPSPLRKALTRESLQSPLQRLKSELSRMSTTSKRKSGSSSLSLSNPPTPQRSMRRKPTFTEEFDDEDYDNIELQNMSHISRPAAAPGQPHFGERNISQHPRETRFGTVNMAQPSVNPALAGRLREADPRQPSTPLSASNTFARVTPMGAYGNITGSPGGTNMKATGSSVVDTTNTLRHARTHSDARREAMEHLEGLKRDGSEEDAEMEQQRIQSSGEGPGQTFLHKMGIVPVKNKNSRSRLTIPDNYTINADGTMSLGALTHNDESHPDLVNTMGHEGQRTSSSRNLIDRDLAQLEAQRLRPHPNLVSSEEARSQQLGWSIIFLIGCHLFPPSLLLYGHGTLDTIMPYLTNRKVGEMNPSLKKYARLFGIAWTVVSIFVVVGVVVAYVLWRHGRHH